MSSKTFTAAKSSAGPARAGKVVVFTRVSSREQTMGRQIQAITELMKNTGLESDVNISYTGSGFTGSKKDHGIKELMKCFNKENPTTTIAVTEIDRLTRSTADLCEFNLWLQKNDYTLIIKTTDYLSYCLPHDFQTIWHKVSIGEQESLAKSIRAKKLNEEKRKLNPPAPKPIKRKSLKRSDQKLPQTEFEKVFIINACCVFNCSGRPIGLERLYRTYQDIGLEIPLATMKKIRKMYPFPKFNEEVTYYTCGITGLKIVVPENAPKEDFDWTKISKYVPTVEALRELAQKCPDYNLVWDEDTDTLDDLFSDLSFSESSDYSPEEDTSEEDEPENSNLSEIIDLFRRGLISEEERKHLIMRL